MLLQLSNLLDKNYDAYESDSWFLIAQGCQYDTWGIYIFIYFSPLFLSSLQTQSLAGMSLQGCTTSARAHGKSRILTLERFPHPPNISNRGSKKESKTTQTSKNPQSKKPQTTNKKKQVTQSSGNVLPIAVSSLFSFPCVTKPRVHKNNTDLSLTCDIPCSPSYCCLLLTCLCWTQPEPS